MAKKIIRPRVRRGQSKLPKRSPSDPTEGLDDSLSAFSDALAFVEVVVRSMDADDGRGGPEIHVLEHGLMSMRAAYTKFDLAISNKE